MNKGKEPSKHFQFPKTQLELSQVPSRTFKYNLICLVKHQTKLKSFGKLGQKFYPFSKPI